MIHFRSGEVYTVKAERKEDQVSLFDALEKHGIPVKKQWRETDFFWPRDTCLFAIDMKQKLMEYVGEPHICSAMVSSGVRIYSTLEFLQLEKLGFPPARRCPVFHVPHDGQGFPNELMDSVCVSAEKFFYYHEMMRDTGIWELVPRLYHVPYQSVRFPVSRLLCDVERFTDKEEIMEQFGMGFCYEKAFDGTRIKDVTDELRGKTLSFYRLHHEQVDRVCKMHKRILFIDMHTYSDIIVPKTFLQEKCETPDVCIGTDPRFTPGKLVEIAEYAFKETGYTTAQNYPYSGCYIPNAAQTGELDCAAIMLEFNKRIYCDSSGAPIPNTVKKIERIVERFTAACAGRV